MNSEDKYENMKFPIFPRTFDNSMQPFLFLLGQGHLKHTVSGQSQGYMNKWPSYVCM